MRIRHTVLGLTSAVALIAMACQSTSDSGGGVFDTDGQGSGSESDPGSTTSTGSNTVGTSASTGEDDDDDGGPLLDVGPGVETGGTEGADTCTAVDILFIIDSSNSMHDEQVALGQAFPQFADTIVDTLPPGTSVHVGVTSAEMSPDGAQAIVFPCDMPSPDYYDTPDIAPSGVNGAQGRLYQVPNQPTYYEVSTDAPAAELQGLEDWFVAAAQIGIDGSSEEMTLAGASWAFDPINDPINSGFLRDEGAVLVLFFVSDESDQTPIDGVADGLIQRIADAKTGCGGLDCVVAGGTVRASCLGEDALGMFLSQLDPGSVHVSPLEYNTQTEPALFVDALEGNLAQVIVETCEEIGPEG